MNELKRLDVVATNGCKATTETVQPRLLPIVNRFPDPLRKDKKQAIICAQLVCAQCGLDLEHQAALADVKTGHAFCSAEHWREFFARKGQIRR
jgi:hypothetical protein